ncbi:MAG: pirin family protein [Planctomycetaceae bacterium]|nr:pirin family protein [Planctomycetaceae bacterium]
MDVSRRTALSVTAAGLIHVAAHPRSLWGQSVEPADVLIRQAAERGHTDLGWLRSYHSFSFADYYDQRHMGFRSLRVINDDRIAARRGFPTHPHRDMEIISYVLDGALQHKDSTGRGAIITPEDIQMMSAGTGITHSEFNPSADSANHFLQIWIQPAMRGARPRYSDQKVTTDQKRNQWTKIAGPDGAKAAVAIRQDALIFATNLLAGEKVDYTVEKSRYAWLQVARGELLVNGTLLRSGDAIATSRATRLHGEATEPTDALLFDLA